MIEGPQAIDDRDIVAGAGAETDTVADLAGEYLNFAFVAPFARRRKMLCCIGGFFSPVCFSGLRIQAFSRLFFPIFFFFPPGASTATCSLSSTSIHPTRCRPTKTCRP